MASRLKFVTLQSDWLRSVQTFWIKKEALCFSRSRERRKFKTNPRVGIVVLTRIAWAAIPTSL
ncbi:hypothetical protein, partial [uncultured Muribaculum sp.]|uniref:hypothetical protein n=1 Tax=uncultured Muribaculum sp. TaxID=1918613 RepID=UPI0025AF61E4